MQLLSTIRNWFSPVETRTGGVTLSQYLEQLLTLPQSAGVPVNEATALGVPALFRAVDLISNKVATCPLLVYRRSAKQVKERAPDHFAFRLLKTRPSDLYSAATWKKTHLWQALIHGNSYSWIRRSPAGQPVELLLLDPQATHLKHERGAYHYETTLDSGDGKTTTVKIAFADVLHLKGLGNGLSGFSVIDLLRDSIGESVALQRYSNAYFKNNCRPGNIAITLPEHMQDDEDLKRIRQRLSEKHTGPDNAFRMLLLEFGMSAQTLSVSNEQSEFLKSREFSLIQVSNATGCPPFLLGATISTSYSSLEIQDRALLSHTLNGWLTAFEEECNSKLLTEAEKLTDTVFCEFLRDSLIEMDAKTASDIMIAEVESGLLTLNEARAIKNRPPVEGGDEPRGLTPAPLSTDDGNSQANGNPGDQRPDQTDKQSD